MARLNALDLTWFCQAEPTKGSFVRPKIQGHILILRSLDFSGDCTVFFDLKTVFFDLKSNNTICNICIEENYKKSDYVNHFKLRKLTEYSIAERGQKSQKSQKYSNNAWFRAVENSVENVE